MYSLKEHIFSFFGPREKIVDNYKDSNGKGLHERFNELLAGDLDDNELLLINKLISNTQNPDTVLSKFIGYREGTFGTPVFTNDEYIRRKILKFISEINRRKGTKTGYKILLNMFGYTYIEIEEILNVFGFDSVENFDDSDRIFDNKCHSCSGYILHLESDNVLTQEDKKTILAIIEYNEPINANLVSVIHNGTIINTVGVLKDENGELYYVNDTDPETFIYIDEDDVIINGENLYFINGNGDLIYKIVY